MENALHRGAPVLTYSRIRNIIFQGCRHREQHSTVLLRHMSRLLRNVSHSPRCQRLERLQHSESSQARRGHWLSNLRGQCGWDHRELHLQS